MLRFPACDSIHVVEIMISVVSLHVQFSLSCALRHRFHRWIPLARARTGVRVRVRTYVMLARTQCMIGSAYIAHIE